MDTCSQTSRRVVDLMEDEGRMGRSMVDNGTSNDAGATSSVLGKKLSGLQPPAHRSYLHPDINIRLEESDDEIDVIDLGAPRRPPAQRRPRPRPYTPNPRLYPGLKLQIEAKKRTKQASAGVKRPSGRKFTRPVPNSRLYRPAPPRPPRPQPPALRPPGSWSPPAPAPRNLETASHVALRLLKSRSPVRNNPEQTTNPSRRLVVSLPAAGDARPRVPSARTTGRATMETTRHSTSPECSDGNDASSAPSEFLAEAALESQKYRSQFLSAIMRRQYAEALKYCRLILQYEPHNATARGFYPLLQHKLQTHQFKTDDASSSEDTSPRRAGLFAAPFSAQHAEVMQQEADEGRSSSPSGSHSGGSCSSLELDSTDPLPSASPSPTPSRHTDPSDRTDHTDSTSSRWDSVGERSERDDNGNSPPVAATSAAVAAAPSHAPHISEYISSGVEEPDVNDNATSGYLTPHLKSGSSLQRLRAQFACSIK